ncbi:MAG: MotA/TolQ/ExbB proton channel family protein [Ferruginibacter sp.]|nr:MotA/TolQ/ExbB proton channel family protein [Cytophagales bacterium]
MTLAYLLLQVIQDAPSAIDSTAAANGAADELNVFNLLLKGGFVMIPLLILSLLSVYLFIERYLYIRKASYMEPNFLNNIKDRLREENVRGALELCHRSTFPIARLIEKGLSRLGSPIRDVENAIENTARIEIYQMEKNLSILAAIAAIAPMFGFLGTVVGMIRAFYNISLADNISIGIIASGIYEKMVTSAAGLIIGVTAHILFTYLNTMIDRNVNKMEVTAIDFMDILHKPIPVR